MDQVLRRSASFMLIAIIALMPGLVVAQLATPVASPADTGRIGEVRLIGVQVLEDGITVDDTLVGGFSGVDYDAENDIWYLISDDRSDMDPARFYTARLGYSAESFDCVSIDSAIILLQENGEPYPNIEQGGNVPDTEAIRADPQQDLIWYSSEGDQRHGIDPFVAAANIDGSWVRELPLPELFEVDPSGEIGVRDNKGFEGLTFSADGETLWLGLEGPLYQDGELSTVQQGATARFTNIDREGKVLGSYVYELDPITNVPEGGDGSSGAAEILAVDDHRMLVVERMSVQDAEGDYTNYIKIYEIDIAGATDVSTMISIAGEDIVPVSKHLVYDLNAEGVGPIDNVEAISWGPVLENGNRSLVLVSDNNFNPGDQVTEFIALEVEK